MSREALHLRVNENDLLNFRKRARSDDREPNDVVRELIRAYADRRISITTTIQPEGD